MQEVLLDTDMLSEVLKQKNESVTRRAVAYQQARGHFTFSSMTRYEILRGLKFKAAARQIAAFETFCR